MTAAALRSHAPRREPGPRDVPLLAIGLGDGRLLGALHQPDDRGQDDHGVKHERRGAEQQGLAKDDREHREVHRITHELVDAGHGERIPFGPPLTTPNWNLRPTNTSAGPMRCLAHPSSGCGA